MTDRGTYLAWRDKLQLLPEVEGDSLLYNVYHVMEVNPNNAPRVNTAGAKALADFLVAPATQVLIGEFGKSRFGQSLFVPDGGKPDRWERARLRAGHLPVPSGGHDGSRL